MKDFRKIILRYLITLGAAIAMLLLVLWVNDYSSATELVDKYRILADSFTVPGVVLVMLTALVRLSAEGAFDGLGYVLRHGMQMLVPRRKYKHETYYDYKQSKGDKKPHGYSCMFFVGIVFVFIAVVFVVLHSKVYVPLV